VFNFPPFVFPTSLRRRFDYEERSLTVALNQLVGREWSFGARYRLSHADLEDSYPELPADIPGSVGFAARRHRRALLRQFGLNTLYAHPAGFFGQLEALWLAQDNGGDDAALKDDDFWQFNVWAGYRFARRRAEVRLGVLNLTDRDYRLNPLNLTAELPRERTFYASLRFNF
jgi:outer membrane receptor protein involved in Fe transport